MMHCIFLFQEPSRLHVMFHFWFMEMCILVFGSDSFKKNSSLLCWEPSGDFTECTIQNHFGWKLKLGS